MRIVRAALLSMLVLLGPAVAVAASGAPIPGATYKGAGADGAAVTFTLSSDGTLITTYSVTGVRGNVCELNAYGAPPSFAGVPIQNNSFAYQAYNIVSFDGSFAGPQSASGTFVISQNATEETKACTSGQITWTATTTSKPVTEGGGPPPGKHTVLTRVTLRKLSKTRLGGSLKSSDAACRAHRPVTLWRGNKRFGSTHTGASGGFSFKLTKKLRGHPVRASVGTRTLSTVLCAAGSSTFVRG